MILPKEFLFRFSRGIQNTSRGGAVQYWLVVRTISIPHKNEMKIMLKVESMFQKQIHSESDQFYRDEIKENIELILKRKMKEMSHDIEEQQIRQLSAAFEAKLYKCAPTLEFHRDYSTLDSRVKLLAIQLGQKLERKKRRRKIPILSDKERISTFNSSERNSGISFEDIQEIVETVKGLRKNGYNDMRLREEGEGATTCRGLSCLVPSNPSKGGSTKHISIAMKNIYFRTRLVEAFEKLYNIQTEEAILSYSKDVDWKSLINEAKENIHHFERWKKIQYPRCA